MNQRAAESRIEQATEPAHSQLKPQIRSTRKVKKPIGIMGLATLLLTTAAFVFMPVTAQAWDWSPLKPSYTYPFEDSGVSIWTSRIGNSDYTTGRIGTRPSLRTSSLFSWWD
mgnify:CR=1 FL=1